MKLLETLAKQPATINTWGLVGIALVLLALCFYKIYLEAKEEEEQDHYDHWNDPDNWRPH